MYNSSFFKWADGIYQTNLKIKKTFRIYKFRVVKYVMDYFKIFALNMSNALHQDLKSAFSEGQSKKLFANTMKLIFFYLRFDEEV